MNTPPEIIPEYLREMIARHTNTTIERCAQEAENFVSEWDSQKKALIHAIAAAIRKLKVEIK